jgi:hypothetical protein
MQLEGGIRHTFLRNLGDVVVIGVRLTEVPDRQQVWWNLGTGLAVAAGDGHACVSPGAAAFDQLD